MSGRPRETCDAGFSLLELLVALAILALALVTLRSLLPSARGGDALQLAGHEITRVLKHARLEAVRTNRDVRVLLDLTERTIGQTGAPTERTHSALPRSLAIEATASTASVSTASQLSFRFFPDGSASGGSITLRDGARARRIVIDWLSGHVANAEAVDDVAR